jgi:Ca2+/Na+ antiporter
LGLIDQTYFHPDPNIQAATYHLPENSMDWDHLCFNTATFIAGVFVLDYGADKFVDHTVVVGQRLGISPTLIALLTAGAEYEEVLHFLPIFR